VIEGEYHSLWDNLVSEFHEGYLLVCGALILIGELDLRAAVCKKESDELEE
jgi:hypothetical protein